MSALKIGSLFSGIGGIDLGFLQAGFIVAFANEMDKYACATYRHNFSNHYLIEADICSLEADTLPEIDVLTAGFPCQPFSVCGKQKGFNDSRGNVFFEIMRIVDAKKPRVIFLENVANLVNHDNGRTFNIIHNELASREYYIRYLIADACDYGIPQHRTRTYIVAFDNKAMCDRFSFPQKVKLEKNLFDVIDRGFSASKEFYEQPGSRLFEKLNNSMADDSQIFRFSDYGVQAGKNGISFTLKANMGTWYNRVPYIKDNYGIRKITPNECLLLQGFSENELTFPDEVPIKEAYKQCGNTVCVPLVYKIASNIKSAINE